MPRMTLGRIALVVAAVGIVWALPDVVLTVFFAALLAVSLRGASEWITARTRLPVGVSLTIVVVLVLAALGGMSYSTGPALYAQSGDLVHRLTDQFEALRQRVEGTPLAPSGAGLQALAERVAAPAGQVLSLSVSTLTGLVVLFVTTLYFASSPEVYIDGMLRLIPLPHRGRVRQVMHEIAHSLRLWLAGQLIDMLVVGVLSAAGLWLVGVPVPVALGLVSGLFTFVPYLGTVVSGGIAVLVGLSVSPQTALWALGVFAMCHVVEGYVVSPLIQRRMVELPPALTVLSMTALGSLFGVLGVIVGTPLAAAALIAVRMLYINDVLGDREAEPKPS